MELEPQDEGDDADDEPWLGSFDRMTDQTSHGSFDFGKSPRWMPRLMIAAEDDGPSEKKQQPPKMGGASGTALSPTREVAATIVRIGEKRKRLIRRTLGDRPSLNSRPVVRFEQPR
jgi:hypothetical protein